MKTICTLVLLFLLVGQQTFGQFVHVHTHINNNDANTQAKLTALITILGGRNASLTTSNDKLKTALDNHKEQLSLQYTKNQFDRGTGYTTTAGISALLSLGASGLARIPGLPYMTSQKQAYLDEVTMDKALLLALKSVSKTNIKSAKRQEIYRLRSKLLREFAKNDTDVRQTLFISAAGVAVLNYKQFVNLYSQLNRNENDDDTGQMDNDPNELDHNQFIEFFDKL